MKIGVLGVGAIGGIIGGYLARANHDVTLIDQWPANVEHIKANGITVTTFDQGPFTAQADALHVRRRGPYFISVDRRVGNYPVCTILVANAPPHYDRSTSPYC